MKDKEMQEHLIKILNRFSMRTDLVNELFIDVDDYKFRSDLSEEDRWSYYISVCKGLKIKDRIIRFHGMKSNKASYKKVGGHIDEKFFEQFGLEIQKGTNKTDLKKDGNSFASVKGGVKIQWGMHVLNKLPLKLQELFGKWISTYENNFVSLIERKMFADLIINKLNDYNEKYYLVNYFFRKNENVPFLIVKDVTENIYYRVNYENLIKTLSDNIEFYTTKDKVKIVSKIKIRNKHSVLFEIEPRTDKNNAILMHGQSKQIINVIKFYNINVEEIYKQDTN